MMTNNQKNSAWRSFTALLLIFFGTPLSGFSTDLYAPSLPHIQSFFHVSADLVQLSMTSSLIGFCLGQIPFGLISDSWGRKPTLITGLLMFAFASWGAAISPSIFALIGWRFVQGFAIAAPSTITKSVVSDVFQGEKMNHAYNFLTLAWGMGPILGPVIGGYLQHYFKWQANFYFFVAYAGFLLLISALLFQESIHEKKPWHPKTMRDNVFAVLRSSDFVASFIIMGLSYSLLVVFHIVAPFFIQDQLGLSAITYGHASLFLGLSFIIGIFLNRINLRYLQLATTIKVSTFIMSIISLTMVCIAHFYTMTLFTLVIPICCLSFCVGTSYGNCMTIGMRAFSHIGGAASAILGTGLLFILSLCTLLASSLPVKSHTAYTWLYLAITLGATVIAWGQFRKPRTLDRKKTHIE